MILAANYVTSGAKAQFSLRPDSTAEAVPFHKTVARIPRRGAVGSVLSAKA
jgi:hypothetical protein